MAAMPKTVWERLAVPLPSLRYQFAVLAQQPTTTTWAAHSHTPTSVAQWTKADFDAKIQEASQKPENTAACNKSVSERMSQQVLERVRVEQDVTDNTKTLLRAALRAVEADFEVVENNIYTTSNPDLVAIKIEGEAQVDFGASDFESPVNRSEATRQLMESTKVLFTFETKPSWKFKFLYDNPTQSTAFLIDEWAHPESYPAQELAEKKALPEAWGPEKKKVFHLIRQVYGQMASSNLRYGIMHIYEVWWFCRRDEQETLFISPPVRKEDTSPSVLQIIKAMAGFDDFFLEKVIIHPGSATKATTNAPKPDERKEKGKRKSGTAGDSSTKLGGHGTKRSRDQGSNSGTHSSRCGEPHVTDADPEGIASLVCMWDCKVIDFNTNTKILSWKSDPSVLVKIPHHPRAEHIVKEMKHEAVIYQKLAGNREVQHAIPKFYGFSTHLGVPMLCISREGPNFEDIGVENLSDKLKASAVQCVRRLGLAGVLHQDLALRNIVQSSEDPQQAKVIDFGRSEFTRDQQLLKQQVSHIETILFLANE